MNTNFLTLPSVSKTVTFASSVLIASLFITGCSKNDTVETDVKAESTESVDTQDASSQTINTVDEKALEKSATTEASAEPNTADTSNALNPAANSDQKSIVTNPTEAGTPEDTVKQALNTLYYGDVKDAVGYYRVDMENFEAELANTQSAFQQTVESVTITKTQYSVDRIRATITGELKLKGQSEPAPLVYQLRKVGSEWKILG